MKSATNDPLPMIYTPWNVEPKDSKIMADKLRSLAFYVLVNQTPLQVLSAIPTHEDVYCCPFFNAQYNIQLSNGAYLYKLSFAVKSTGSSL